MKPYCHNCTRLNKLCVYPTKPKFKFETPKTTLNNDNNMLNDQALPNGNNIGNNSVSYQFLHDKSNILNLQIYYNETQKGFSMDLMEIIS